MLLLLKAHGIEILAFQLILDGLLHETRQDCVHLKLRYQVLNEFRGQCKRSVGDLVPVHDGCCVVFCIHN